MERDKLGKKIWLPKWLNIPMWFQNDEDDVVRDGKIAPPDWFEPDNPHRLLHWRIRNPLHNASYRVFGVADRLDKYEIKVSGDNLPQTWAENGWNGTTLQRKDGKGIKLPFKSYNGKVWQFYWGWQPNTGKLGFALRHKDSSPEV